MKKLIYLITALSLIVIACEKKSDNESFSSYSTLHIGENEKELYFFGSEHSNDSSNKMFDAIEISFNDFWPDLTLIEGGYSSISYISEDEAIRSGEMAFVSYLSKEAKIPRENIEPSEAQVNSALLENYTDNEILTMYVVRQIYQYQREAENKQFDFGSRITNFTNGIIGNQTLNFENELSFSEILELINRVGGLNITDENWRDKDLYDYVYKEDNIVSKIRDEVMIIRDDHAVDLIIKSFEKYDKIYVIMGSMHLLNQRDRLKQQMHEKFGSK